MMAAIDRLTDRILRRLLFLGMAGCLCLGAIGVGAASLYQWLLAWIPAAAALAIIALLMLVAGLLLMRVALGARRRPIPAKVAAPADMPALIALAGDLAGDAVKADPLGSMLGASALGFILESRPDLDHALVHQILRQWAR
ncbi:hypothetical protein [Dongia sp.]|uniref:hypothetical protein n=1 Tax=Dongia sp. TaxID=1977262 RepID=UPI0035ADE8EE